MHHVKNQHIVPQFLLREFSADKKNIWSFDKSAFQNNWNSVVKERSIQSYPTIDFFYDRKTGEREGSLEYMLKKNEDKAFPILSKLIVEKNLVCINLEEKTIISLFVSNLMLRTEVWSGLYKIIYESIEGENSFELISDTKKALFKKNWLDFLENSEQFVANLLNKSWSIITSPKKFYISDNPVVLANSSPGNMKLNKLGIVSPGIEIYLPLNSSVILSMSCKDTFGRLDNFSIPANFENVKYLNSLQINYSNRFVFSEKNDFDLAYELLKNN